MAGLTDVAAVAGALAAMERRLASINANWNGQNPDVMNPAQVAAFKSQVLALAEENAKLVLAVGEFSSAVSASRAAGIP